ncbi:MAG: hypothetical protein KatS3mg035_1125 [Bacteroidia bacterium]|nr:MAG: hypothetical protein KatS3mg035_1125 [Bacteroidia bacterium]
MFNGKDMVQDDFELIAFDFVSSPSTPGAYLFKEGKDLARKGMIPLKEDSGKIMKLDSQKAKEQYEYYTKLFNLSNNHFWKNL